MGFQEKNIEELQINPFTGFAKEWVLITAEKNGKANTMTAAWGGLGNIWGKNVAYIVIRPQRYTKEFVDGSDTFSLTVLPDNYRKQLVYLGTVSGRNEDKINKAGLTLTHEDGIPYFEESKRTYLCKKVFATDFVPENFIDVKLLNQVYPEKDYHTLYIGEIIKVLEKQVE